MSSTDMNIFDVYIPDRETAKNELNEEKNTARVRQLRKLVKASVFIAKNLINSASTNLQVKETNHSGSFKN